MKGRDWALMGIGAAIAVIILQVNKAHGYGELSIWLGAVLLLVLAYTLMYRRLHASTKVMNEIRRISVASANTMIHTSDRLTKVHQALNQTHQTVGAVGVRLKTMHDRQLAISATLRSRYPIGEGSPSSDLEDELVPEHSGEFSAYGRAIVRTMQPRPLHRRPHAFDSEDDGDVTTMMQRPRGRFISDLIADQLEQQNARNLASAADDSEPPLPR